MKVSFPYAVPLLLFDLDPYADCYYATVFLTYVLLESVFLTTIKSNIKHFQLAPLRKTTIAFSIFLLVLILCLFQKIHSSKTEVCSDVHFK